MLIWSTKRLPVLIVPILFGAMCTVSYAPDPCAGQHKSKSA